jgi:hypothetical protein
LQRQIEEVRLRKQQEKERLLAEDAAIEARIQKEREQIALQERKEAEKREMKKREAIEREQQNLVALR